MAVNLFMKVLVIAANPFSDVNNNGKTLKSIFSSYAKEELCELYFRPQDNVIGDGTYADSYYAVCEMDIIRSFMRFNKKCGGIQTFDKAKSEAVAQDKTYRRFFNSNIKNWKWLRSLMWKTRRWDTAEYRNWIKDRKADVVFALLGSPGVSYTMAEEISESLNIPLAVYFTDDYLIYPIRKGLMEKWRYKRELKAYRQIVRKSTYRFCIGEQMCQEYTQFFGKEFRPIMNCVDVIPFEPYTMIRPKPVFSYFGGLNLHRWKMLCRLSRLLGDKGTVMVYTNAEITDEIKTAFINDNVKLGGFVCGDMFRQKMLDSDVLLHIESDDAEYRSITRLSISTKIPEYMMSSRMILGFGPQELASMKLLNDNHLGVVINCDESEDKQKAIINNIIDNGELIKDYAARAYEYAKVHHNKNIISNQLRNEISHPWN